MNTKTSFHINGFWFHVNWNQQGTVGTDQHGQIWLNKQQPRTESGGLVADPMPRKQPALSNKELFGMQRESYYEFFHSRSALIRK